uniref:Lon protease homolog n=1 Tax=Panagrellus redivivus TaxID=6233 RepID=A0A7E4UTQ1_PANRE
MRLPVLTDKNLAMIDSNVLGKDGIAPMTMIVIAYKHGKDNTVFPIGTSAIVESFTCYTVGNTRHHYTLQVNGVSRVQIAEVNDSVTKCYTLNSTNMGAATKADQEFVDTAKKMLVVVANKLLQGEENIARLTLDALTDLCMSALPQVTYLEQLEFLAELDVLKRVDMVIAHVRKFMSGRKLALVTVKLDNPESLKNDDTVVERMRKTRAIPAEKRSDYRLHAPRKSIGEDEPMSETNNLGKQLQAAGLPEGPVKDTIMAEFRKYQNLPTSAAEHPVLRSYLQLVIDLPWSKLTSDKMDIKESRKLLEADHEGMDDVKKRILEFLAVKQLKNDLKAPILCLAGPPGVGKTSVAKSIANALGRNFQRIALGGIRDQSDIRGHRRTYVGAMPGRIINSLKQAKSRNPVILLDEVDKLGHGPHGDPSAALLEVLDPEQNHTFTDLYLNVPFDLSQVIFIATANDINKIPNALYDRMELVQMSSYSLLEKLKIAKTHIIPKQMAAHAVTPDYMSITDEAITSLIEYYTHEAGVRQLERAIGAICRNVALRVAEAINAGIDADVVSPRVDYPINIAPTDVEHILGNSKRKKNNNLAEVRKSNEPGVVLGLAWTPVGGEVLVIETALSEGKGTVILTGNLGTVIKESIQVALSFLRANAVKYELDVSGIGKSDLHVHLPAGAVGKDGPSAGCAFTLALFSLISGRAVRKDTAVTGEVTLTGKVLPVGGVKEKVLAAHRNKVYRVILPRANQLDTQDIDATILKSLEIEFVDNVHELFRLMIDGPLPIISSNSVPADPISAKM